MATLFWLPPTASFLPNVKLIQFFSAGTNHVAKHPIYTDSKIPLCSANGVHGPQIAEWVIMMDLVHSHSFPILYDLQKKKEWKQRVGMNVSDRVGKRVGILGYGSIGRQGESLPASVTFRSFVDFSSLLHQHAFLRPAQFPTPSILSLRRLRLHAITCLVRIVPGCIEHQAFSNGPREGYRSLHPAAFYKLHHAPAFP